MTSAFQASLQVLRCHAFIYSICPRSGYRHLFSLISDEARRQLKRRQMDLQQLWRHRCFAAAAPRLWNNLPAYLRQTDINFDQFS